MFLKIRSIRRLSRKIILVRTSRTLLRLSNYSQNHCLILRKIQREIRNLRTLQARLRMAHFGRFYLFLSISLVTLKNSKKKQKQETFRNILAFRVLLLLRRTKHKSIILKQTYLLLRQPYQFYILDRSRCILKTSRQVVRLSLSLLVRPI